MLCRWFRSAGLHCVVIAVVVLGLASMLEAQTAPFTYVYDEAGRLVGVVDAAGNTTTYTYDATGNIVSIVRGSSAVSILEFSPNSGPVGTRVTITGAGFSATAANNAVTFNGVSATVESATANQLVAVVPAGATTGPIGVTSPSGNAVSAASFIVGPGSAPTISGFTPTIGVAGSAVTITGTNFETAPGGNKVGFNGSLGAVSSATTTTIGAVVPSTATSGHISVTTPNGRAVSSGDFFVPPSPYTAADVEVTGRMATGDTLAVPITVANKIGMILFDGAAGQRIALSVSLGTGLSGGSCDTFSIRRPDGAVLASASACSSSGFIDLQVLPVGGTYLITFDPAGTATGTATLTLHDVPADAAAPIVPGGAPVTVTTTVPGQNAVATFSGVAGQRISLNLSFGAGLYPASTCNSVSIQNPDGTALISQTTQCGSSYFSDVRTLPATGIYAIKVNPGGTNVGSATLTLYDVPPDASPGIVPGGPAVDVIITTPGQNAQLSFAGTAGQRVSLSVSFGAGLYPPSLCHSVSIQNPDGTALISPTTVCGSSYFSDVRTLPATGVYVIMVNPGGMNVGTATLTLYDIPPDASPAIVPGGPAVDVTITTPGQNAQLSFNGNAGQRVSLNVVFGSLDTGTCNAVSIQNPDGTTLHSQTSACSASYFTDVLVLPATGTYTITINPGGTNVGTATLTLYDVPADALPAIVPGGPAVDAIITTPGQNARLSFSGSAGQRVSLNVVFGGLDTSTCNAVSIQNPDGTTLHSQTSACSASYFTDVLALPATGTYTITVNPGGTNVGTATLTLYDVPPDASPAIVPGGSAVAATITAPGQNAQLSFSGTAGQRVSLNVAFGGLDTSTCNTVSIQNPDGTSLVSSGSQCGSSYYTDVLTLPASGTYTITLNPGGLNVGTATLTLYDVPPDASPAIVPGGSAVSVTITTPGQNAQLSFNGTAGQRVSLNVVFGGLDASACNTVSIQKPDGTSLVSSGSQCGASYFTDVLTLPATGVYVITLNPGGLNVGTATLTLYDVPPDATPAIVAGGSAVAVTITTPGQNAQLSFSGAVGQRVSLNVAFGGLDTSTCNTVSIQKPDGTSLVSSGSQCGASYFTDVLTLPAAGTYTITLNPGGLNVGTATLTLYDVPADLTGTVTVGGPAAALTTTAPGQNATLTFSGSASQAVTVRITGNTMGLVTVTLRKPDGSTQTSSSSSAASFNLSPQTLSVAGTYTIFVNPNGTNIGSINVAVTSP